MATADARRVQVLVADPELGLRVPEPLIRRARAELLAPVRSYGAGTWELPTSDEPGLGYLVLEGLLAREVLLAGQTCAELLGEGDLLQSTSGAREDLIPYHVSWCVLAPVRLAVLDGPFAKSVGEWPQVMRPLLERAVRRTQRLAIHQALLQLSPVETRIVVLFWHLAARWGRMTPAGVVLRLPLSHRMLGELVGCRRASVTTALHRVVASGRLEHRGDGSWLLGGEPPDELAHLHWGAREARVETATVEPALAD